MQEAHIKLKEEMCNASPLLIRWLKRSMARCFDALKGLCRTEKRNRLILMRMKYRLQNACVVAAFSDWNWCVFYVVCVVCVFVGVIYVCLLMSYMYVLMCYMCLLLSYRCSWMWYVYVLMCYVCYMCVWM